jgi:hypothetical protein
VITQPGHRAQSAAEIQALFAAARRRRRRRRTAMGVACLVLSGSAAAGLMAALPRPAAGHQEEAAAASAPPGHGFALPRARVAWVDYGGLMHIGDLATGAERSAATVDASPADPMIVAGGRLYWADIQAAGPRADAPIRSYDIATGKIGYLPRGNSVFASADGRHLYIARTSTSLVELPTAGVGAARQLTLPAGWYLSGILGNWSVAGGIVVYSSPATSSPAADAIWNPETGRVTIIGSDLNVIDTYTPHGGRYSLIAWTSSRFLGVTNTATMASLTIRSPNRWGFTYGGLFTSGAFSPDGAYLVAFLNTTNPQDPSSEPVSEPAVLDTRTGALRLVQAARLGTYEDAAWSRWLPGGHQFIVGAEQGSYAVDAATLAVRTLPFAGDSGINFSATIMPAR